MKTIPNSAYKAALDVMRCIDEALESARRFPDAGSNFRHDNLDHEYRTVLASSYIVFYRFNDATLTVYRILHQRQDLDAYVLVGL